MSNAAKYKKKAAELELQKQFDKAVAMYVRAIEAGDAEGAEVDVTVLNKVGDLTLRLGRVGEAVTSYERAVEHYTTVGLFNNAIALCNKILRHAPGRAGIYLTLGRVCAKKGMRGDATRNFLEYASRMKQEGRTDEAMRSLAEVAGLMPELDEVRRLVEEHAERVGIALPAAAAEDTGPDLSARRDSLVFLDIDYDAPVAPTPPLGTMPIAGLPTSGPTAIPPVAAPLTNSLDDLLIFDPLSDDALPEEPITLEDLEALPDDAVGSDVPSLLTPTEPVAVDPSLAAADGLTDALGFDVDDVPSEAPLPLDGLVSDADDAALIAPQDVEPLPVVDDVDSLPVVDDVDSLPVVDDVDSTPVLDDVELPLAVEPLPHVEAVESSTPLDPTEALANAETLPSVELPTLTPYRGSEAITPPATELDTLSPYDGVASIASPDDETVAPVALDTLSPYDGVASVPPPSDMPTPPLAPEFVAPESAAPLDEVETVAELAMEQVEPAAVGDDSDTSRPLVEMEAVDEAAAASADVAAIIEVPEPIEIIDVIDAMDFVDAPEPIELLDVPDGSESIDVTEVFERVDVVDAMDFVDVPDPIEIMDVADAVELIDVAEAVEVIDVAEAGEVIDVAETGEIIEVEEAVEIIDVAEAFENVDVVGAMDREDGRDAIEILDVTEALATEEVVDPRSAVDPSDHEVPATLDAQEASVSANDDDVQFAALLVNTPLPPAHSTRPARAIPRLDPHDFILPGELPPIVLPTSWLDITPPSARPIDEVANTDEAGPDESGSVEVDTVEADMERAQYDTETADAPLEIDLTATAAHRELDDDVAASAASETLSEDVTDESGSAPIDDARGASASSAAAHTTPDGLEGLDDLDHLDELDAAFTPSASSAAFNLALNRCERLREEVDANLGDWARRRRLAEALLEAGERASGLDELAATALGLELEGALPDAVRVLDDLVRVAPDQVAYHQKRVELSVRLGDRDRLRESYLDLADALVRSGNAVRAEPVYVRVLELDPWDDRARAALGDAAPPPPSPKPSVAPADDGYVNLADWLADDAAPRDTRMRVKEPTVTGDEDADFDELLRNFREGVARSLGEDDYESHYDLGVAYKEMGLLDDAVAEFQRALRSPTHRLPAYEALGQCFLEQGSFPVAVTVLSRALHEPGLDDEQRVGVLYLLGYACEALQRRDEARSYYQRVYATDIHFRDVAERLTALDGGAP